MGRSHREAEIAEIGLVVYQQHPREARRIPFELIFIKIEVPILSFGRFDNLCECTQINERGRVIDHIIEDGDGNGERNFLAGMSLPNCFDNGCHGPDARRLSLWGMHRLKAVRGRNQLQPERLGIGTLGQCLRSFCMILSVQANRTAEPMKVMWINIFHLM